MALLNVSVFGKVSRNLISNKLDISKSKSPDEIIHRGFFKKVANKVIYHQGIYFYTSMLLQI